MMLATITIGESDMNVVMAYLEKAKEHQELFPKNFQEHNEGKRLV